MEHRIATVVTMTACLLRFAPAFAGSCGTEVAELRESVRHIATLNPNGVGTAPQTIGAQLEHQPAPSSVARAQRSARNEIAILLAYAQELDAGGEQSECRRALDKARGRVIAKANG